MSYAGRTLADVPDLVKQRGGITDNAIWEEECAEVLAALENAEAPLTVGEVAMVTFLGEKAARNRLNFLRERGAVERVRDDSDRRVVRYAAADGEEGDDA